MGEGKLWGKQGDMRDRGIVIWGFASQWATGDHRSPLQARGCQTRPDPEGGGVGLANSPAVGLHPGWGLVPTMGGATLSWVFCR